jgi:hypothetical protein
VAPNNMAFVAFSIVTDFSMPARRTSISDSREGVGEERNNSRAIALESVFEGIDLMVC